MEDQDIKWLIRKLVVGGGGLVPSVFAGDMSVLARVKVSRIKIESEGHARGVSTPACPGGSCP